MTKKLEKCEEIIQEFRKELALLAKRGYGARDRILRKLIEELGEYAEAIEYSYGSTGKKRKFAGKASPAEKLKEEACDLVMMAFAAVQVEGIDVIEACRLVTEKLARKRGGIS